MDPKEQVLELLASLSGKPRESLRSDMDLVADLELDSPKALQLLLDIEEKLGIEIQDEDAARMETVGDILGYLETHARA